MVWVICYALVGVFAYQINVVVCWAFRGFGRRWGLGACGVGSRGGQSRRLGGVGAWAW